MTAAETGTGTTVRCSFCGQEHTEVSRVVAGAGVYICDECVRACESILEQEVATSPRPRLPRETMIDAEILAHIPRIAAVEAQVERDLQDWVRRLRDRGVTWERIGSVLGITRQSAWERFTRDK